MRHTLRKRALKWLALAGLVAALVGCQRSCSLFTTIDPDDAGHWSFVRQVVPKLMGRKVQGQAEAQLMVDVINATPEGRGREELMDALMASDEFASHWAETLVDVLRVNREGIKQQSSCYGAPLRSSVDASLAQLITSQRADAPLAPAATPAPFNMSDVVAASVAADNLYALYAAHVFALESKPISGNETTEANRRDDLGGNFNTLYLNRKLECMQCHNSSFSRSGPQTYWQRTYPIWGKFEAAIYENEQGGNPARFNALFRTGISSPAPGQTGLTDNASTAALRAPWGNLQQCGAFHASAASTDSLGIVPYMAGAQPVGSSVWTVQALLGQGRATLAQDGLVRSKPVACSVCNTPTCTNVPPPAPPEPATSALRTLFQNKGCFGCHRGASPAANLNLETNAPAGAWAANLIGREVDFAPGSGLMRVVRGDPATSYLVTKLRHRIDPTGHPLDARNTGGAGMPPVGYTPLTAAEITQVEAWITSLPTMGTPPAACGVCQSSTCTATGSEVDGPAALAYLTGLNAADQIWQEMMGSRLTIANYFPRNQDEMRALWNLNEFTLLPNDWSLRAVLKRIALSDYFNRRSPRTTAASPAPYNEPLLRDPWVEADPRVPPIALPSASAPGTVPPTPDPAYSPAAHTDKHRNAMSEGVHRYSVRSLAYSMHRALGWPAPSRFPSAGYPSQDLLKSIGQFSQDAEPGFRDADFQGLLQWESVHKSCTKPAGTPTDWVDRLLDRVRDHNAAAGATPLTLRHVALVMKDWFIGDASISNTTLTLDDNLSEKQVLDALFGSNIDTTPANASPAGRAALETQLREYCGVLVQTPQYWLAGIAPTGPGDALPIRVCNNAATCSYEQMCAQLSGWMRQAGSRYTLSCGAGTVSVAELPTPSTRPPIRADLCRGGVCGFVALPQELPLCLKGNRDASACLPERPPRCDLGCQRIDCCGGPLPPLRPDGGLRPSMMLGWFEGSQIGLAEGVRWLPAASRMRRGDKGESKWQAAAAGQALGAGDILEISPRGRLEVKTARGPFATPQGGLGSPAGEQPWYLMVTGPTAAQGDAHPMQALRWALNPSEVQQIERYNAQQHQTPAQAPKARAHDPALRQSMRAVSADAQAAPADKVPGKAQASGAASSK